MSTKQHIYLLACFLLLPFSLVKAQQSKKDSITGVPGKAISSINNQVEYLNHSIDRQTEKYLRKIQKEEALLKRKLMRIDSNAAKQLFDKATDRYAALSKNITGKAVKATVKLREYIPGLDSSLTALKFLDEHKHLLKNAKNAGEKLSSGINNLEHLQEQLKNADALRQFIKERKKHLHDVLSKYKLEKYLKRYNKHAYYFAAQVAEYKNILNDPGKAEQLAVKLLSKIPEFKEFFASKGLLAGIFPGNSSTAQPPNLTGLQSRAQVQQYLIQQSGGPNNTQLIGRNIQNAQSQVSAARAQFAPLGNAGNEIEMPGFKVNPEKTKSFGKRLEYGISINTAKGRGIIPNSADIAAVIGYKLNGGLVIGAGINTKTGLGNGLNKIRFSYEGVGARSYIDWKIPKAKFWLSGGYELNYFSQFKHIAELKNLDAWQHSCLFGLTKKVQLKNKGMKMQLLWDALAERHTPNTTTFLYRIVITK